MEHQQTRKDRLSEVQQFYNQRIAELSDAYSFLSDYQLVFGHGKRTLGSCRPTKKEIRLSRYFIALNPLSVTIDTLNHELAHAIDYQLNGFTSHGPRWKKIAQTLGATPKAYSKAIAPQGKWTIIWVQTHTKILKLIASRHRRSRNLQGLALKNHPESLNQLFYVDSYVVEQFETKQLSFDQLLKRITQA